MGLCIQRILPDTAFIDEAIAKAKVFVKRCILSELVGRYYTRSSSIPAVVEATNEETSSMEVGVGNLLLTMKMRIKRFLTMNCTGDS